jgi:uncharacterized protein (DUF1697 family)
MRYVAFLRAINTGNRRIKMVDLRALYEDLGYSDVDTYIASGNVVFDAPSPPPPREPEASLAERFGFAFEVFLRSGEDLRSIVEDVPWRVMMSWSRCRSSNVNLTSPRPDLREVPARTDVKNRSLNEIEKDCQLPDKTLSTT